MVPDLGVFGIRDSLGRPGEVEDPGWIQELVDIMGKALGSWTRVITMAMVKF